MYKLSLYNNGTEIVAHYPSANIDDPHVNKLPLKEKSSSTDSLSFTLYTNNPGYKNVYELTTKVKVFDVRDNSIRFTGRILNIDEKMDSDGKLYKDVTCEGAMAYLNDTKQRGSSYYGETGYSIINQILNNHNSKVDDSRKIYPGTINMGNNVTHSCEYKSTLAEILSIREDIGGEMRVRESNNKLYLDWVPAFETTTLDVSLGVNMKDMVVSKDITSIGTRIIPLGANNLTIESVNGGVDYIDDSDSINKYGVIEKTVEYNDIENATELRNKCLTDLKSYTQPSYELTTNALDLSYLTGNKAEQFKMGTKLHIVNEYMGVNDNYNITEISLNLLEPYNPTLTISNKSKKLTDNITDLRKTTIQNDGVYNNVQIGRTYGIRAVRSDNKVITTINATEGISIENDNEKLFYVDTEGNLVAVNIQAKGGTFDDITAEGGTFNDITAEGGTFNNITCFEGLTVTDDDVSCSISKNGFNMVSESGKEITLTFVDYDEDDNHFKGLNIDGKLWIQEMLKVEGKSKFNTEALFLDGIGIKGELSLNGNMKLKNDDDDYVSLKEYIQEVIDANA